MPHFLPAAAIKPDIRPFNCKFERFFVHVTKHQDFAGIGVLNDGGNQTLFIEFISLTSFFILLPHLH